LPIVDPTDPLTELQDVLFSAPGTAAELGELTNVPEGAATTFAH
jgi:hypothetical protein